MVSQVSRKDEREPRAETGPPETVESIPMETASFGVFEPERLRLVERKVFVGMDQMLCACASLGWTSVAGVEGIWTLRSWRGRDDDRAGLC